MIELKGTREEIAEAVAAMAPDYPVHIIYGLDPGEWHFFLNGIDVEVTITG